MSALAAMNSLESSSWVFCEPSCAGTGQNTDNDTRLALPSPSSSESSNHAPIKLSWADEVEEEWDSSLSDTSWTSGEDVSYSLEDELNSYTPDSTVDITQVSPIDNGTSHSTLLPTEGQLMITEDYLPKCQVLLSTLQDKALTPIVRDIGNDAFSGEVRLATQDLYKSVEPCYSVRNLDRAFRHRGLEYSQITENELFYQVPSNERDEHVRTIIITGLQKKTTKQQVLERLHGGKVVRMVLCDTTSMIGSLTAFVEFATAEAAIHVIKLCTENRLLSQNTGRTHVEVPQSATENLAQCEQDLSNVNFESTVQYAFVTTPTMSKWRGLHTTSDVSRCIELTHLHATAKKQLAYDFHCNHQETLGLTLIIHDKKMLPGTIRFEFTSMLAAQAALTHIRTDTFHYGGVRANYCLDPCESGNDQAFIDGTIDGISQYSRNFDLEEFTCIDSCVVAKAASEAELAAVLLVEKKCKDMEDTNTECR